MRRIALIASMIGLLACEALVDFDGLEYSDDGSAIGGRRPEGGGPPNGTGVGGTGGAGGIVQVTSTASSGGPIDPDCELEVLGPDLACPMPPCTSCATGLCNIACTGVCPTVVNCPPGYACTVTCDTAGACAGLTIQCPEDHPCQLNCVNPDACAQTTLLCSKTAPCSVICSSDEMACYNTVVHCGPKACKALCADADITQPGLNCAPDTCLCEPC